MKPAQHAADYDPTYLGPWAHSEGVKAPGNDLQVEFLHRELLEGRHAGDEVSDKQKGPVWVSELK